MGKYTKQIWISAPPENVVDAIDTPKTWRVIVPSMQNAEVSEADDGGYRLDYTYKLGGVRFERTLDAVEAESDTQRVFEVKGPIRGRTRSKSRDRVPELTSNSTHSTRFRVAFSIGSLGSSPASISRDSSIRCSGTSSITSRWKALK